MNWKSLVDTDECVNFPCQHGATCVNTPGGFDCRCVEGWKGPTCAVGKDLRPLKSEILSTFCSHNIKINLDSPSFRSQWITILNSLL